MSYFPYLGLGLGLRPTHYQAIIETGPKVDWFEAITEDYLVPGGNPLYHLDRICERYPIVLHGVSLSIGGTDPLDMDYLRQLKQLINRVKPRWVSDHLCWTGANGINLHDLMPLPYTEEAVQHLVTRITQVQDYLGQRILLENVSSYISYTHSAMSEWEFITAITEQADCLLLLDINNIYVSAFNHGFNPLDFIHGVPANRVQQFHLAGHLNLGTHIIDTHDHPIIDEVWSLYAESLKRFGPISAIIERDDHIPPLEELVVELDHARTLAQKTLGEHASVDNSALTKEAVI
jgi:uncharacterized protein (UPF0276 family)